MPDTSRQFHLEFTGTVADAAMLVALVRTTGAEHDALIARLMADAGKVTAAADTLGTVAANLDKVAPETPAR